MSYKFVILIMAITIAFQIQIIIFMVSLLKMGRICSLIKWVITSQLPRWKYGKSQRWNNDDKQRESKTVHILSY